MPDDEPLPTPPETDPDQDKTAPPSDKKEKHGKKEKKGKDSKE